MLRGAATAFAACFLLLVALSGSSISAYGQPVSVPDTYGGDLSSRPRLTGSWDGARDAWAKRGVVVDLDLTQTGQGVLSGGRDTDASFGGRADMVLNVDSGKAGLWPGGFLKVHAQGAYGQSANGDAGAVQAVNETAIFPVPNDSAFAVPNFTFTQFLSPKFGVFLGKVETLGGDANEFAHYDKSNFMNLGFGFNLTNILTPPSALGAGLIAVPWRDAVVVASVIDPNGQTTEAGFDEFFEDGVTTNIEGRITVQPFGLKGHQLAGFTWSSKNRTSLEQDSSNIARALLSERFPRLNDPGRILRDILERFFPGLLVPVAPLNVEDDAWNFYYNFDQFLWSPAGKPDAGIGAFFRFGISDGKTNPIKYHYSVGIGGKNIVPGRPNDSFGVGWSRIEFSDDFVPFLRQSLDLGLDHEDVIELYYNFAVTNWLNVTADIQIVDPGLQKKLNDSGALEDVDTAFVAGLRTRIRF